MAVEMMASFRDRQKMSRYVRTSWVEPSSWMMLEVDTKNRWMFSKVKAKLSSVNA